MDGRMDYYYYYYYTAAAAAIINHKSDLLCEIAGFIDISVSLLLQLVDDLALLLCLLPVVLDLLLEIVLRLFVKFHEVDLLLRLCSRLQHVLYANSPNTM